MFKGNLYNETAHKRTNHNCDSCFSIPNDNNDVNLASDVDQPGGNGGCLV